MRHGGGELLDDEELSALGSYVKDAYLLPPVEGDLKIGQSIFERTCSVCHGERGDGASWARNSLDPPPLDFRSAKARELSRRDMLVTVAYGEPGTAMVGFRTQLDRDEIAAVVDYVRTTFVGEEARLATASLDGGKHHGDGHAEHGTAVEADFDRPFPNGLVGDRRRGADLYANCVACHGVDGKGDGPRAAFMHEKPEDFTSDHARAELDRPHLFAAISKGVKGSEMPAWSKVLSAQQIADVAEHVLQRFVLAAQRPQWQSVRPEHGEHGGHDHSKKKP